MGQPPPAHTPKTFPSQAAHLETLPPLLQRFGAGRNSERQAPQLAGCQQPAPAAGVGRVSDVQGPQVGEIGPRRHGRLGKALICNCIAGR